MSAARGLAEKGFSMDLAPEWILKDEEEGNRPTGRGQHKLRPFGRSYMV